MTTAKVGVLGKLSFLDRYMVSVPFAAGFVTRRVWPLAQARSHSRRLTPACRRRTESKPMPMSPRCGFGIVSTVSSRTMNSCLPPE